MEIEGEHDCCLAFLLLGLEDCPQYCRGKTRWKDSQRPGEFAFHFDPC